MLAATKIGVVIKSEDWVGLLMRVICETLPTCTVGPAGKMGPAPPLGDVPSFVELRGTIAAC